MLDPARPARDRRYGHLAIHPYPVEIEKVVDLPVPADGPVSSRPAAVLLRAIRPDDAEQELARPIIEVALAA